MQVFGKRISHLFKVFFRRYAQIAGDEKVMAENKFHLFLCLEMFENR
jgi:hypothetical protein